MSLELKSEAHKGIVKAAMLDLFQRSAEQHTVIQRKPEQKVTVTNKFGVGKFVLSALTPSVILLKEKKGDI